MKAREVAPLPGSDEWRRIVSASKVAAIMGLSPYDSPLSMWHLMHGDVPADPTNADQLRGQILEASIVRWWRHQHPEYRYVTPQRVFRPFDWALATPDLTERRKHPRWVLDAKTAARDDDWGKPGTDEVPLYYLTQAQWQMWCAGPQCTVGYIAVLGGYLTLEEYVIERDDVAIAQMVNTCLGFVESLRAGTPPPLDGHPATLQTVKNLNPDLDPALSITVGEDVATAYLRAQHDYKAAEDARRIAQSALLEQMGVAKYAQTLDGQRIARRQLTASGGVSLVHTPPKKYKDAA